MPCSQPLPAGSSLVSPTPIAAHPPDWVGTWPGSCSWRENLTSRCQPVLHVQVTGHTASSRLCSRPAGTPSCPPWAAPVPPSPCSRRLPSAPGRTSRLCLPLLPATVTQPVEAVSPRREGHRPGEPCWCQGKGRAGTGRLHPGLSKRSLEMSGRTGPPAAPARGWGPGLPPGPRGGGWPPRLKAGGHGGGPVLDTHRCSASATRRPPGPTGRPRGRRGPAGRGVASRAAGPGCRRAG